MIDFVKENWPLIGGALAAVAFVAQRIALKTANKVDDKVINFLLNLLSLGGVSAARKQLDQ